MPAELRITRSALERIRSKLSESSAPPGSIVRLRVSDDGAVRLITGQARANDELYSIDDTAVLAVNPRLRRNLAGSRLTVSHDAGAPDIVLR